MNKSIVTIVVALAFGFPAASFAAEKKGAAEKAAETTKKSAEKAVKEGPAKVVGEGKAIPMHVRADSIDAKAKTFTMKRKDGTEVKHVLTDATTIMNGESTAKLDDIKVGEYVSGLRRKVSDTEYEVVKITKFGAAPERKAKAAPAEGEKKAE